MTFAAFTAAFLDAIDHSRIAAEDEGSSYSYDERIVLRQGRTDAGTIEPVEQGEPIESLDDLILSTRRQHGYIRSICESILG